MSYKIFISLLFCFTTAFVCNKPKLVLERYPLDLPRVDSINNAQCVVRYKSSLYDNNLSLLFNVRIIYFEEEISEWLVYDTKEKDDIIINNLNNTFRTQGISFILKESNVDVSSESINEFLAHYQDYEKSEVLTILVYSNHVGAVYNGIASGVPGTVMGIVDDKIATSTLPHEASHLLGLSHLFEKDDTDGKNAYSGDKICDTGAFNIMDNKTKDCGYTGKPKYSEEDLKVIIPNYMNYNAEPVDCRDRFTPVQMLAIRWHIENFPKLYDALSY